MPIFLDQTAVGGSGGRLVPVGGMMYFAGAGAPSGYLIRDGSSVPVATYPALFAVIGYTYGGAGANFNLPDDLGLCLAGAGLGTAVPGLTNHPLGSVGGSETHTMSVAEIATHTHLQNAHTHIQDAHNHTQDAHNHTDTFTVIQNSHNHTQDAHLHSVSITSGNDNTDHTHTLTTDTPLFAGGGFGGMLATPGSGGASKGTATGGRSSFHQHSVSGNTANATATNQSATATNQATNITTDNTTATNQTTTATNQNTTAVNQNEGSSTPFNIIQPTRYYIPCIAF